MSRVTVEGVAKSYGEVGVLDSIDLEVDEAEVVVLLGPSGCGKTTLLRLVAGLDTVDRGVITIADRVVSADGTHVLPEQRQIGLVFQDGALFPHLTVGENVGFGLPRPQRRSSSRIDELLELVGLAGRAADRPDQLSGGQRQRVALARALAPSPEVLLLDEPFSNLDAALRVQLREEVARTVRGSRITSVFVTHDRAEAFALGDRIAVMAEGRIEQIGSPEDLYARPVSPWVATFVGDGSLIDGVADGSSAITSIGRIELVDGGPTGPVMVLVRPEQVVVRLDRSGTGRVVRVEPSGSTSGIDVVVGETMLSALVLGPTTVSPGDAVEVAVIGSCVTFPPTCD
jgi:iron(III) transport system ATP-binding protein